MTTQPSVARSRWWLAFGWALVPALGSAATFQVTRTDDPVPDACLPADCSLREAVRAANAQPGRDLIRLPAGNYVLEQAGIDEDAGLTGDIDITDDLEILGDGPGASRIDPRGLDYVLDAASGVALTVRGVGLVQPTPISGPYFGGGIRTGAFGTGDPVTSHLTLEDVLVNVYAGLQRAGISARGRLHATRVMFLRGNEPSWALAFGGSDLRLHQIDFQGNMQALTYSLSSGGQARITDSRFADNGTASMCTTIQASGAGTTLLQRVTIKDNFAFGSGTVCVSGGARMILRDSTFVGNRTHALSVNPFGGTSETRVDLHNVTMTGMERVLFLGGIGAEAHLHHATLITASPIYAVEMRTGARLHSTNSVVAGGCASQNGITVETEGANFEAPNRTCFPQWQTNYAFSSHAAFALGALQENGGPTLTALPLVTSPLVTLSTDAGALCPPTDQRGYVRPRPCTSGAADPLAIDDALLIDGLDF